MAAFAYFAPTIVRTLGYSTIQTQLHTVPPAAAAFALCLIMAYLSDRSRLRLPFIVFGIALIIAGLGILLAVGHEFHAQYAGIHLVAMGAFSIGPIIICWYVMNLKGHVERSIGTAWMIGFGNCGGFLATFTFQTKDAPLYHTGYSICIAMACVGALAAASYGGIIFLKNKRIQKGEGTSSKQEYYSL